MVMSATRMATFMACNRKGGWTYVAGIPDPGNEDTGFGQEVHDEIERLKTVPGALPDRLSKAGAVAAEALPYVEDLSVATGAKAEGDFTYQGRHLWRGRKDLVQPGEITVDYKTTSDFKWAKTPEELLYDPQAVLYAQHEFSRSTRDIIELRWIYLRKRTPYAAKVVSVMMTRDHAARAFAALESFADELQGHAWDAPEDPVGRHRYVLDVMQPNYGHCDAYRGCPHQARCGLSFFREKQEEKNIVGLLERMLAKDVSEAGEGFNPTQEIQTDAPTEALAEESAANDTTPVAETAPGQVNPPRRRGRPPGSKNKPTESTAAVAAPATNEAMLGAVNTVAQAPSIVTPPAPRLSESVARMVPDPVPPTPKPSQHRLSTLYVGCMPQGVIGELPEFDKLVAEAKVALGPQDWRTYEYGKGNGLLLDMFQAVVQHRKPASLFVASPRAPEAVLCLSYLRSISDVRVEALPL